MGLKSFADKAIENLNISNDLKEEYSRIFNSGAKMTFDKVIVELDFYISMMSHDKRAVMVAEFIKERIILNISNL